MQLKKNKIVFICIIAIVLLFIIAYSIWVFRTPENQQSTIRRTELPQLDEKEVTEYETRLEAIEDLRENRERTIPNVYWEDFLDSLGYYDPDLREKEKKKLIDSIFDKTPDIAVHNRNSTFHLPRKNLQGKPPSSPLSAEKESIDNFRTAHSAFFQTPFSKEQQVSSAVFLPVIVDGDQVVQANSRLRMRVQKDVFIEGKTIPRNTLIYGFVSIQPNRVQIRIETIQNEPLSLTAFDAEDGSEEIYVENNLRSEIQDEVTHTTLGDINVPGVPNIRRVGNLLRRNQRREKVTLLNHYKLILKPN